MKKIIIIAGATATGKTALSVELAQRLGTQIISCDSMQIYKSMDIGTAKVKNDEMQGVKHCMIDIVEPDKEYSVGEYSNNAIKYIDKITAEGHIPVVVGGTGLYIDSILYQMSFGGEKDQKIRDDLQEELQKYGNDYMYDKLMQIDPEDALKMHKNNTKRVLRALEIYYTTGKKKSQMLQSERALQYDCCMVVLNPDRDVLYDRINKRVDMMFDEGLENEVKQLVYELGVGFDCQSMQAIGYKEFKDYFENNITLSQLKEKIKQNSRNYAKRQITWLKRYDFAKWFDPMSQRKECIDYILQWTKGE